MNNIDTQCIQAGYSPKAGEPRIIPICQSTTYAYDTAQQLADLFDLKAEGFFYSRLANPTVSALEEKIAILEGGSNAIGLASGMSAVMLAALNIANAGDNIVCSSAVYGGTYNLFDITLKKYGITTRFFNPDDSAENIEKLIDDNTKLIYAETIANPTLVVIDFDKLSSIAKKYKILFAIDNTLVSPALCQPFEFGVNIIIHSTSKYIDGHATSLGGVIVDGGNFDFTGNKRYAEFNTPDESYHGLIYANLKDANGKHTAFGVKLRAQLVRDTGAIMSPMNAFLTNLGCETLALRMERHSSNANKIAKFLEEQEQIEWVKHPSLASNKYNELYKKYLPNGCGGMLAFGVKGGANKACALMENLKLIRIVTHVADIRSCVIHPASTTHRQMSSEALAEAGIPDNLIRLSVGCESVDDLLADLKQALAKI